MQTKFNKIHDDERFTYKKAAVVEAFKQVSQEYQRGDVASLIKKRLGGLSEAKNNVVVRKTLNEQREQVLKELKDNKKLEDLAKNAELARLKWAVTKRCAICGKDIKYGDKNWTFVNGVYYHLSCLDNQRKAEAKTTVANAKITASEDSDLTGDDELRKALSEGGVSEFMEGKYAEPMIIYNPDYPAKHYCKKIADDLKWRFFKLHMKSGSTHFTIHEASAYHPFLKAKLPDGIVVLEISFPVKENEGILTSTIFGKIQNEEKNIIRYIDENYPLYLAESKFYGNIHFLIFVYKSPVGEEDLIREPPEGHKREEAVSFRPRSTAIKEPSLLVKMFGRAKGKPPKVCPECGADLLFVEKKDGKEYWRCENGHVRVFREYETSSVHVEVPKSRLDHPSFLSKLGAGLTGKLPHISYETAKPKIMNHVFGLIVIIGGLLLFNVEIMTFGGGENAAKNSIFVLGGIGIGFVSFILKIIEETAKAEKKQEKREEKVAEGIGVKEAENELNKAAAKDIADDEPAEGGRYTKSQIAEKQKELEEKAGE